MKLKSQEHYRARANVAKAMGHPSRMLILDVLREREMCVCELTPLIAADQSTVSRHLAYLKRSCWVDIRREGVWMHYTLSRESCDICRELLLILKQHAGSLPEAVSDRTALAAFLKDKPASCP